MSTIVLLGTGQRREFAFKTIFRRNERLILVDKPSNQRYFAMADIPVVVYDPTDETVIIQLLRSLNIQIDGVVTWTEHLVPTAAKVGHALGVPSVSIEAAEHTRNKFLMRQVFSQHSFLVPQFTSVSTLEQAYYAAENIGYPVVLKPIDFGGSVGVVRVDKASQLNRAFAHTSSRTHAATILMEEYLDGPEFYVNAAIYDGRILTGFVSDRIPNRPGQFFVEEGHEVVSFLPQSKQLELIRLAEKGATCLGIQQGLIHAEIKWIEKGPVIIEIAARAGGGLLPESIYLAYGINLYDIGLSLALGQNPEFALQQTPVGCSVRYLAAEGGQVTNITGIQEVVQSTEGLVDLSIYVSRGSIVKQPQSNAALVGHLVVIADTKEQAQNRANQAANMIIIDTAPYLSPSL